MSCLDKYEQSIFIEVRNFPENQTMFFLKDEHVFKSGIKAADLAHTLKNIVFIL